MRRWAQRNIVLVEAFSLTMSTALLVLGAWSLIKGVCRAWRA